jgi:hypothetical protein
MMFHVWQKVECIDDSLPDNPWHRQYPLIKGQIYVVYSLTNGIGCIDIDGSGRAWQNWQFRPLINRETDIGFAYEILRKATKKVSARMK